MTPLPGPLAIMGGAFDPVHFGHLRSALELRQAYGLAEVRFVPSANPPHRAPHIAPAALRVEMLRAATADLSWCSIDDRELRRDGPSWTVLTLEELRAEAGRRSLCMILGMDAFLGFTAWHRWQEIPRLAHLLVAHRPGWRPPAVGQLGDFVSAHLSSDPSELQALPAGRLFIHEVTQLEISSSAIRASLARGMKPYFLMPDAALEIAAAAKCYHDSGQDTQESSANAK